MLCSGDGEAMDRDAIPPHHLLAELRVEAKWANAEYDAAAERLAAIEKDFNDALYHGPGLSGEEMASRLAEREKLEDAIRMDVVCDIQALARNRLHYLESAYEIASSRADVEAVEAGLHGLFLDGRPDVLKRSDLRQAFLDLATALHEYGQVAPSDGADRRVRHALHHLESEFPIWWSLIG